MAYPRPPADDVAGVAAGQDLIAFHHRRCHRPKAHRRDPQQGQVRADLRQPECTKCQRKFLWVRRGCQASQRNGWPPGKSGELPGKSGELPGKCGKLPGNLWIAILQFHSERTSGEVAENFRGSSGNFRGSPGTFQKLGGAWLALGDSPNLSPKMAGDGIAIANSIVTLAISTQHKRVSSEENITRVARNLAFARKEKKTPFLSIFCLFSSVRGKNGQEHFFSGSDFGRTDFSRIFVVFGPPDFLADSLAGFFLIFAGKSAQKNPPENPRQNPPKFIQQKSPTHFCRGATRPTFQQHTNHKFLQGAPLRGRQLYFTFPSAPDPLFKASKSTLSELQPRRGHPVKHRLNKRLGQKSCRTKVSRIFRIFVPDFAPNFAPNFPRIFRGFFVLRFMGDGDQKKFTKNPRHFSMQNSQANTKKIFTKFFWRSGKVTKGHQDRWVSKSQVLGTSKTWRFWCTSNFGTHLGVSDHSLATAPLPKVLRMLGAMLHYLAPGKYGCRKVRVYSECGQQLGRDPSKFRSSRSLVLKGLSGEGALWNSSLPVSLTLWDTPVLCTLPLPFSQTISQYFSKGPKIETIQDLPPRLKFSSENDHFKQATRQGLLYVGGLLQGKIEGQQLKGKIVS